MGNHRRLLLSLYNAVTKIDTENSCLIIIHIIRWNVTCQMNDLDMQFVHQVHLNRLHSATVALKRMIVSIFGITSEEIIVFGSVSVNKKKTAGTKRSLASKKNSQHTYTLFYRCEKA